MSELENAKAMLLEDDTLYIVTIDHNGEKLKAAIITGTDEFDMAASLAEIAVAQDNGWSESEYLFVESIERVSYPVVIALDYEPKQLPESRMDIE